MIGIFYSKMILPMSSPLVCCRSIEVGDICTSPHGDCAVFEITRHALGWKMYKIRVLESGKVFEVNRLQIWKITDVDEMSGDFEQDLPPDPPPLEFDDPLVDPSDIPQKKRFVAPQDEAEIDDLAEQRLAKETQTQTRWAVKVFKGNCNQI